MNGHICRGIWEDGVGIIDLHIGYRVMGLSHTHQSYLLQKAYCILLCDCCAALKDRYRFSQNTYLALFASVVLICDDSFMLDFIRRDYKTFPDYATGNDKMIYSMIKFNQARSLKGSS